jgi:hypothetical protein
LGIFISVTSAAIATQEKSKNEDYRREGRRVGV